MVVIIDITNIVKFSTAVDIISGKNNEPTVVMTCTFVAIKDGLGS
jgi:hypothetical protein